MPAEPTPTSVETGGHAHAQPAKVTTSQPVRRVYERRMVVLGFLLFVALLVAIDLGIKSWSFEHVAGYPVQIDTQDPSRLGIVNQQAKVVVPHVLSLWLTTNTGAVFGSAKGAKPLFIAVSVIAVVVVLTLFLRSAANAYLFHIGLALVLSGALGNLYDRLMYSAVRDMFLLFPDINLPWGLSWPGGSRGLYPWIFNFADVALVIGVLLLGMLSVYYDKQRQTVAADQD